MRGTVGGKECVILIEEGRTSATFGVALSADATWYSDQEEDVLSMANETQEATIRHTEVLVGFSEYAEVLHLHVVDALLYDVILGHDWLHDIDPRMETPYP